MKRTSAANQILHLLFLFLIIVLLPVSVLAQETTLTANVPSVHTLYIGLSGNGRIVVDGVPYQKTVDIQIRRHSTPAISVTPDSGWKLKSVSLGGQDITGQIQNGIFTLSEMCDNVELSVVFEERGNTPQTGDKTNVEILSLLMLLSMIAMVLCVIVRQKTRNNIN